MSVLSVVNERIRSVLFPTPRPAPSWPMTWWQEARDYNQYLPRECATVEACVSAYAQTIAQLPIYHWREQDDGGDIRVRGSDAARIMRQPNDLQTRSQFILTLVRFILFTGNSYSIILRDDRNRPRQLIQADSRNTAIRVDPESGSIFYEFNEQPFLADADYPLVVPSRDVLHIPFNTDRNPLIGETPLTTAALAISTNTTISAQAATFFKNMSRASGVLVTDERLSGEQIDTLRQKWLEQSAGLNSGGVPILASGLKWQNLSVSAHDSEVINTFKMTVEDISRAMRVPLPLLNALDASTYNNTEALMRFWLSSGLGFLIEHIEEALDRMFKIPEGEYLAFDTSTLLRMDLKGRMEALGTAVTKGIMSPNEARAREGLPSVEGGDMPRVQQQMVPLNAPIALPATTPQPAAPDDNEPEPDQPESPQNQEYAPVTLRDLQRVMGEIENAA